MFFSVVHLYIYDVSEKTCLRLNPQNIVCIYRNVLFIVPVNIYCDELYVFVPPLVEDESNLSACPHRSCNVYQENGIGLRVSKYSSLRLQSIFESDLLVMRAGFWRLTAAIGCTYRSSVDLDLYIFFKLCSTN